MVSVLQGAPAAALERPGKLLSLAQQYLEGSPSPAMPALAEAYLAQPMSQLAAALASLGPLSEWDAAAKSALDAQLQLSALMLRRCQVCTALLRTGALRATTAHDSDSPWGESMAVRPRTACPEGAPCLNYAQHVVCAHITFCAQDACLGRKMVCLGTARALC